ncbi:MAG: DUF927 domain-containing protein [Candidatus Thiodiazotropha endolucinida]|nr:DUF927 domain-containing protein [Candidatus Thiodiazotropha taylori]MCG8102339.1 DUF927 domain-containing protein [Candidatus Thiodiazotropha taylori]MCW4261075.1 DUF927 domain-containing protein [Candidatus Thiodiazotropha endolucinida]MCW4287662.1 DUF927 domain-containing protein [Candidatus Thiodiazotropha endolucinida]
MTAETRASTKGSQSVSNTNQINPSPGKDDKRQNECNPFVDADLISAEDFPITPHDMWYGQSCVLRDTARNGDIPVCDFIVVFARTFDSRIGDWGIGTWHFDPYGQLIELFHKASDLVNPKAMASRLMSAGLHIYGGGIPHTLAFIKGMRSERVIEVISRPGWHKALDGKYVYARPDGIIGASRGDDLVFHPSSPSLIYDAYHASGTLREWQAQVHRPLSNSPIPVFAQSAALSGVLLSRIGLPGFAADINGPSTTGKTISVQSAVSMFGNAEDTATANGSSCIQGLKTTDNAFEHLAAHSNDGVLGLDETGNSGIKDTGSLLYLLQEGTGKARMNMDTSLRDRVNFNSVVLLSGERSIHASVKNSAAGQRVRVLEINVPQEGAIRAKSSEEAAEKGALVKDACGKCYGRAALRFIAYLIRAEQKDPQFFNKLKQRFKGIYEGLVKHPMTAQQRRACQWFAVSILAAELACACRVFTRKPAHYAALIEEVMQRWLTESTPVSDAQRAVAKLKRFIIANPNKFPSSSDVRGRPNGIVGFKRSTGEYLLSSESLVEASGSLTDAVSVARELSRQGFLQAPKVSQGSLQSRASVTGVGRGVYYIIHQSFLSDAAEDGDG